MNIGCEIASDSRELLQFFQDEYGHFAVSKVTSGRGDRRIFLRFTKNTQIQRAAAFRLQTRVCSVLFFMQKRRYVYKDLSFADDFSNTSRRILKFFYNNVTSGVEEGNLFLLSSLGEMVESQGFLRLHACAFSDQNGASVFPGDSGFGKSTLAKDVLIKTGKKILSDEMVFFDGKLFYPFPLRISLKESVHSQEFQITPWTRHRHGPKWQVSIPNSRVERVAQEGTVFVSSEMGKIGFFFRVLLGYGLPQMKEYFLRKDNFLSLFRISLQRLILAIELIPYLNKIEVKQRQSQKLFNLLVKSPDF